MAQPPNTINSAGDLYQKRGVGGAIAATNLVAALTFATLAFVTGFVAATFTLAALAFVTGFVAATFAFAALTFVAGFFATALALAAFTFVAGLFATTLAFAAFTLSVLTKIHLLIATAQRLRTEGVAAIAHRSGSKT